MLPFKSRRQHRPSSPSQARILRRHRVANAAPGDRSPWRRLPTCDAAVGRGGWATARDHSPSRRLPACDASDGRGGWVSAGDHSPWRRHLPTCDAGVSQGGRARSSDSPFERSGRRITTTTINQIYPNGFSDEDHYDGRNDGNDDDNDYWTCDDDDGDDQVTTPRSTRNRSDRSVGSVAQATATDEKWEGLGGGEGLPGDGMIVWPPMVVVLNTRPGKKVGSDKWRGIGNEELLHYFKDYEPVDVRSSYGFHGHCVFNLLIFDGSISGYHQAERLHNRFIQEGRGKRDWHKQKSWKQTTKNRLLYGYMANKEEELAMFSSHTGDIEKLEYEMKPYQMVVGNPLKEIFQKQASLQKEIEREIQQKKDMKEKLYQRDQEIEALKQKLSQKSDEDNIETKNAEEVVQSKISKLKENTYSKICRNKFVLSIQLQMIKLKLVRFSSQIM